MNGKKSIGYAIKRMLSWTDVDLWNARLQPPVDPDDSAFWKIYQRRSRQSL